MLVCPCIVSVQCQSLLPLSPVPAHPTTPPAPRCPSPPPPLLLAMASAPPAVASSWLRLPLSNSASCPLPVLATHPERCPRASVSRSTSSYWREASHCQQEPSALSLSPPLAPLPPLHPQHLTLLLRVPAALPQTLPRPLRANTTKVCVSLVKNIAAKWLSHINIYIFSGCFRVMLWLLSLLDVHFSEFK